MSGFSNAVVGGVGTLIRNFIKSFNYIAGVAGWIITKDGSAEFNNATVRGTVVIGSGTITMDAGGIHVQGATHQWDINANAGFESRRLPDDGTLGQIFDSGFFMTGPNPSPNGFTINVGNGDGKIFAGNSTSGSDDAPFVNVISPTFTGKPGSAGFFAQGQSGLSATDNSLAIITGN